MKVLKILATGLTGGFSKSPDLQARFIAWLVFTIVLLGAFTFDSWISYSVFADYLSDIGSAGEIPGLILSISFAAAATAAVGVISYAFVSYRKSAGGEGPDLSDSLRFAGYVAGLLYIFFAGISILANIQGANQAAERNADSHVVVDDSPIMATTSQWTAEKQATAARYDTELSELKARIAAIEDGTSKEQGYFNGQRGNAIWKGERTPYGRALLADLRGQITSKEAERRTTLASLDATYQTRLDTERESYSRKSTKHQDKKENAQIAIRFIVFLIYPIGLGISIFNAHFVYDVQEHLGKGRGKSLVVKQGQSIGFPVGAMAKKADENGSYDIEKIKAELRAELLPKLRAELRADTLNNTGKIESIETHQSSQKEPQISSQSPARFILSNKTPYNLGKQYNLSKHEKKQVAKVNKIYIAEMEKTGSAPSTNYVASQADMAWATAKKYLDMIQGGDLGN